MFSHLTRTQGKGKSIDIALTRCTKNLNFWLPTVGCSVFDDDGLSCHKKNAIFYNWLTSTRFRVLRATSEKYWMNLIKCKYCTNVDVEWEEVVEGMDRGHFIQTLNHGDIAEMQKCNQQKFFVDRKFKLLNCTNNAYGYFKWNLFEFKTSSCNMKRMIS